MEPLLKRRLSLFILVASLLIIFFAGTFPFDFTFDISSMTKFDWRWNQWDPGIWSDRLQNVLFFMPFGFGLAAVLPGLWIVRILVVTVAGMALSGLIESSQMFVSFRDPSLMDLWTNTLGGGLGAILFVVLGNLLLTVAVHTLLALRFLAQPAAVAIIAAGYAAIHLWLPLTMRNPADLSVWDNELPMVIGNELTADRPWNGEISRILLADRAVTADEVQQLLSEDGTNRTLADSRIAEYDLRGPGPYPDRSGHLAPLEWIGSGSGSSISPDHWLKTSSPVTTAVDRIRKSSQFTFAIVAKTFELDQHGPARLASISGDPNRRNVQLGQEYADLSVRVRMAMRSMPDLYVRNVFIDDKIRKIVVSTADAQVVVYVDGAERGRVQITPEAKVIWRLYPRGFRMRMERYGFRSYAAIYRLMVFIPFAAILSGALGLTSMARPRRRLIGVCLILVLAVALEIVLGVGNAEGFQPKNLLMSLIIGCGTLALLRPRQPNPDGNQLN